MAFKAPILDIQVPVVGGDGRPASQFQIAWQILGKQVEAQDAAQTETANQITKIKKDIKGLKGEDKDLIEYLGHLNDWLTALSDYLLGQATYTQCVLAKLVIATETDVSACGDPASLPAWPGDLPKPPDPPAPEPTP